VSVAEVLAGEGTRVPQQGPWTWRPSPPEAEAFRPNRIDIKF